MALAAVLCLALIATLPAAAQGTPPKQPAQQQPQQAGQAQPQGNAQNPTAPQQPPVNKEEEDAYKAFFELSLQQQGPQIIAQGENFLARFPTSRYRPSVFAKLLGAYLNAGQADKLVTAGEKAIGEDPENVAVLAVMASVLPRTVDPTALDADQKLSEAERYGRHVIELTATSVKPEGITEEQFAAAKNERLGLAHTGLGLVLYMRGNTAKSVEEFDQATKLDPTPDPLAYYLLGDGDRKLNKFADASAAFTGCSKTSWAWQDRCKKFAEETKKLAAAPPAAKP